MRLPARVHLDDRSAGREAVELSTTIHHPRRPPADILIDDMSLTGFSMAWTMNLAANETFAVSLPQIGTRSAVIVRAHGSQYGCQFLEPLTAAEFEVVTAKWIGDCEPFSRASVMQEGAPPPIRTATLPAHTKVLVVLVCGALPWSVAAAVLWAAVRL